MTAPETQNFKQTYETLTQAEQHASTLEKKLDALEASLDQFLLQHDIRIDDVEQKEEEGEAKGTNENEEKREVQAKNKEEEPAIVNSGPTNKEKDEKVTEKGRE